jgi:hypothetical protein
MEMTNRRFSTGGWWLQGVLRGHEFREVESAHIEFDAQKESKFR